MLFLRKSLSSLRSVAVAVAAGFLIFSSIFVGHANAAEASSTNTYVAADGTNLTAVAQCLPSELSKGDLGRAVRESLNDYLEKAFGLKQSYDDYKVDETEANFLMCLESKGLTPQVKRASV